MENQYTYILKAVEEVSKNISTSPNLRSLVYKLFIINNFNIFIIKILTDFYLFITEEHLYDVTLAGEDKHIMTHKVILFWEVWKRNIVEITLEKIIRMFL